MKLLSAYGISCLWMLALIPVNVFGSLITVDTQFSASTSVLSDGRGFDSEGIGLDTVDNWTFYARFSSVNRNLIVPFGLGPQTLGEQEVRIGTGLELEPVDFFFGFEANNFAIALRSRTFTDVVAGTSAWVNWTGTDLATLKAYYSLNGGSNWSPLNNGIPLVAAGSNLEVMFVGNDSLDSTARLQSVSITYDSSLVTQPVPEPSAMAMFGIGFMVLLSRRT